MTRAHFEKRGQKPFNPKLIGQCFELICGKGYQIKEAAEELDVSFNTICGWLTRYWFYKKINDPVTIVLKSKV